MKHWFELQPFRTLWGRLQALPSFNCGCQASTEQTSITHYIATELHIRPTQTSTAIFWERPVTFPPTMFALYRSSVATWKQAHLVRQPIFCATNPQRLVIEYSCVDEMAHETEETYYWLLSKQGATVQRQGPFQLQTYKIASFTPHVQLVATA